MPPVLGTGQDEYTVPPPASSMFVRENYPVHTGPVNSQMVTDGGKTGTNRLVLRVAEANFGFPDCEIDEQCDG